MPVGTKIILEDRSDIPSIPVSDSSNRPIIFTAFTSDKGTEEFKRVQGNEFFEQYGTDISFKRHGQPLLQAAMAINQGAILYAKRVVDPQSKLACFGITATVVTDKSKEGGFTTERKTRVKVNPATGAAVMEDDGVTPKKEYLWWFKNDITKYPVADDRPVYATDHENDAAELTELIADHPELLAYTGSDVPIVPAEYPVCKIRYNLEDLEDNHGGDINKIANDFLAKYETDKNTFPLFVIGDNGRGVSNKRIIISPDTPLSRSAERTRYILDVFEGDDRLESMVFSFDPDDTASALNIFFASVVRRSSSQVRCIGFEDQVNSFFERISEFTGIEKSVIAKFDIFNGLNYKGQSIDAIKILYEAEDGSASQDICDILGLPLRNGDNGPTFGNNPIAVRNKIIGKENIKGNIYAQEFEKVFNGTFSDEIYDYDNNNIDVVIDANYPDNVKKAISSFAEFRQDVFFFRDIGVGYNNYLAIKNRMLDFEDGVSNNRYSATYCQTYERLDPYTKKNIRVTIGYDIARLIPMHWGNGRHLVLAGQANGWTIPDMVEGTLSYSPKITPSQNQQEELDELRVNFGYYQNNTFTFATEYTAQTRYTQLSFINNMLLVQNLIKDIRVQCPKSRYRFITGEDFIKYEEDINAVITNYNSRFDAIKIEWQQDAVYSANKIVYAVIKVKFKDFAQYEIFRIIAVPIGEAI